MAAVYSVEEGSLLQTNIESAPLENQEDVVQEQCTGSGNSDKVLNVAKAAEERDARAGGPVPEAPEHEEEGAVNAAVPLIKIKEEQIEENEYITVRLNVAGEDSDEQAESNANLSSVAESTDVKRHSMRCQDCGQQFICWEAFKIHLREHMKEDVKLEGECRKRPVVSAVNETNGPHLEKKMRMGNEEEEITVTHEHHTSSFESNCQIKPYEIFIVRSRAMLSEDGESMCSHEKRVYVCSICGKMYACPETFRNHQKLHLNENQKGGEFSCKECGKCFARSAGLAVHMRYHRLNDLDQPTGLRCEQCNRNFHTLHTFTAHQEMHKQGLWCHKCAKGFKSKETLDKHLLGHSTKKHTCHVCQKSFRALSALRHHFHIHTVARTYRCSTCFEAFSQLGNLLSHRKQHLELSKNGRHCRKGSRFKKKRRVSVLKKLAVGGANVMDKHEDSTECPVEDIDEESDEDSPSSSESSESSASTGMSESSDSSADSSTHLSSHSSAHSSAHLSDDSSDDSSADSSTIRQSSPDSSNLSLTDSLADSSADSLADSSTSSLADSLAESSVDFSIDSSVGSSATSSTGEHEEEPTDGEEIEGEVVVSEGGWECFECGVCFVREPELHMHYMKHASGEI